MIEAKISCDSCKKSVVVALTRAYEDGHWYVANLGWTLGGEDRCPKKLQGWTFSKRDGSAQCPLCIAKAAAEAEAKRPRTLEERIEALEKKRAPKKRRRAA